MNSFRSHNECHQQIYSHLLGDMQEMDDHDCVVFEGFGTQDPTNTQPLQDEITANWTDALVDAVFNDPDCDRLLVSSIISAIKEMGFPEEYSTKVMNLEQQLDPKREGLVVDKPGLRQVVEQWIKTCNEEKDAEDSFEADINVNSVVHFNNSDANSSVDFHLRKEDCYKNEIISSLHSELNVSEDKVKTLQLEIDKLKKTMKTLQTNLQRAEVDKVHAEESKTVLEEALQAEISRKNKEVLALEKQLVLAKEQIAIVAKENDELCTKNLGLKCSINDLRDELVTKCDENEELFKEKCVLTTCVKRLQESLVVEKKEKGKYINANLELMEHAKEWKRNIQELKGENNVLSKKLLVMSSRMRKREEKTSNSSDFGSDSSNIAEFSVFSPDCFSSPVQSKKLSTELLESHVHETSTMESTKRISRPVSKSTDGPTTLKQNVMRKRKLFDGMESSDQKRLRGIDVHRVLPTMGPLLTATLPLERPTSFAINLTLHQKLVDTLRHTLNLHPHLFGCIRDFIAGHFGNSITTGSEQLETNLTSLFYEFCTTQLAVPFQGRQFLRAIGEETPSQSGSTVLWEDPSYRLSIEPLNNAVNLLQLPGVPENKDCDGKERFTETRREILVTENAAKEFLSNVEVCVSELETSLPSVQNTSSLSGTGIVEITNNSDATDIDGDFVKNVVVLPNETEELNRQTSGLESCSSGSSDDVSNLVLPTNMEREKCNGSQQEVSVPRVCGDAVSQVVLRSNLENNDDTEVDIAENEDIDDNDMIPDEANQNNEDNPEVDIAENEDIHDTERLPDEASQSNDGSFETISTSSPRVEELGVNICATNSNESDLEFQTARAPFVERPLELPPDLNFDELDNIDWGFESFYDTPAQSPASHNVGQTDNGPPFLPNEREIRVNRSVRSTTCRYFYFMMKLIIFFLLPLLFFLCFFFAKFILTEEEYKNLLLALGGTYHPAEHPLY